MKCAIDLNVLPEAAELFKEHHGPGTTVTAPNEVAALPVTGDDLTLGSKKDAPAFLVKHRSFRWVSQQELKVTLHLGIAR